MRSNATRMRLAIGSSPFAPTGQPASSSSRPVALPPTLTPGQQATLAQAQRQSSRVVGIPSATWTGRAAVQVVRTQFDIILTETSARRYLHRLDFVRKRPRKQLVKADADLRAAFVHTNAKVVADAEHAGASILLVDDAHFRADAELAWQWTPRGTPALVPSTSPLRAEKAAHYSAVCLETGTLDVMELVGTSSAADPALRSRRQPMRTAPHGVPPSCG